MVFAMRLAIDPAYDMTKEQARELGQWATKNGPKPEWLDELENAKPAIQR